MRGASFDFAAHDEAHRRTRGVTGLRILEDKVKAKSAIIDRQQARIFQLESQLSVTREQLVDARQQVVVLENELAEERAINQAQGTFIPLRPGETLLVRSQT